ncbi:MAG: hypothetical protein ACI36Y_00050 [Coriobacteriales bacterium]
MAKRGDTAFSAASPRVQRARQFMPFMALKGYYELCRQQERCPSPRRELTEEEAQRLSRVAVSLSKGDMVRVTFYDQDAYVTRQGVLAELVPELRYLRLVRQRIDFGDILSIEPVGEDPQRLR